ncbi:MAG: polyribonucleotide nucleotidyltransferase [Candidatus Cryosericum sp.]|nr:polyribonucleotide nucleotidyltransferase [Candidatus Cryosericum sp.]HPS69429.1 polyribonucleotide nucleotidyltransferase [Candidatus Cryosericum sp.]
MSQSDEVRVVHGTIAGRPVTYETGRLAKQAGGAVLATMGGTVVLATATVSGTTKEGIDFFPLTVDYFEKMYAAGKIPGGFYKREGRPSEREILRSRVIDRSIRPLFPKHFRREVQVIVYVLSADTENSPDILAINAVSAALLLSDAPFVDAVGAVRVGKINGELVFNPPMGAIDDSLLDLTVSGTRDGILMVESGSREITEAEMVEALVRAEDPIRESCRLQEELRAEAGKDKIVVPDLTFDPQLQAVVRTMVEERLPVVLKDKEKLKKEKILDEFKGELASELAGTYPDSVLAVGEILDAEIKRFIRHRVVTEGVRIDGRRPDEIRPIGVEVGILPMSHGSGLFSRGQTQVLSIATLGGKSEGQLVESLEEEVTKHYMHYYNFPPFSVGETRPMRGPGRREVGHGALGERALLPVIPDENEFPYSIRVVSEVLESNGSTSQASICGSTLALMDAGVPIKAPVAGIAMGLMKEGDTSVILTDIQGAEDANGDMDFKVAGTAAGITALQMDIKIHGVDSDLLSRALDQARTARLFILDKMLSVLPAPRSEVNPLAPRIFTMQIPGDKIGTLIGPGGKVIKKIIADTGCDIDIEDDGSVFVTAPDGAKGQIAMDAINAITEDIVVGKVYTGKVTELRDFGAFVEIAPGKSGLLHVSQVSDSYVKDIHSVLKVGDEIQVKTLPLKDDGKISLTRKGLTGASAPRDEHGDRHHGEH